MLTLTKGNKPISRVTGGALDGKIIYIDDKAGEFFRSDPVSTLGSKFFEKRKKLDGRPVKERDVMEIFEALKNKTIPSNPSLRDIFDEALSELESRSKSELYEPGSTFIPSPNFIERDIMYIAGPSGSGKSHFAGNYIRELHRGRPDMRVILISKIEGDKAFDGIPCQKIIIDRVFIDTPPAASSFKNCIVVFDDIENLADVKAAKAAKALRDELLESGRHYGTYVLTTAHQVSNYKESRIVLNECTSVTIFPGAMSTQHLSYFLGKYFGFSKEQIKKVAGLRSRWITVYKKYPQYCVHERGVFLF